MATIPADRADRRVLGRRAPDRYSAASVPIIGISAAGPALAA